MVVDEEEENVGEEGVLSEGGVDCVGEVVGEFV